MAEFIVTSTADDGSAGTLRAALAAAELNGSGHDTITFAPGLAGQTIYLSQTLIIGAGNFTINGDTNGDGDIDIAISGENIAIGPAIIIAKSATVSMDAVKVSGSQWTTQSAFDLNNVAAGGIANYGTLNLTRSEVVGNAGEGYAGFDDGSVTVDFIFDVTLATTAGAAAGGIFNAGTLNVNDSGISNNHATGGAGFNQSDDGAVHGDHGGNGGVAAGGIYNNLGATLTLNNVLFDANTATGGRGGQGEYGDTQGGNGGSGGDASAGILNYGHVSGTAEFTNGTGTGGGIGYAGTSSFVGDNGEDGTAGQSSNTNLTITEYQDQYPVSDTLTAITYLGTMQADVVTTAIGAGQRYNALSGADDLTATGGATIDAGAGNDTIRISGLADYINGSFTGGMGSDTLVVASGQSLSGAAINLAATTTINTNRFTGFENFTYVDQIGWGSDFTVLGGSGANRITLGKGGQTVQGFGGADTIDAGADYDTLSYADSGAGITLNLSTGINRGGDAEGDVVSNFESYIGSAHADTLIGSAAGEFFRSGGGNDVVQAGAGDDFVTSSAGADTLDGGDGFDVLDLTAATSGATINFVTNSYSGAGLDGDTIAGFEWIALANFDNNLTLTTDMSVAAGAGSDMINGSSSASGTSVVRAGAGADTITVSRVDGNATWDGDFMGFSSYESAGDKIDLSRDTQDYDFTLSENAAGSGSFDFLIGNSHFNSFETIVASAGRNQITGSGGDDIVDGAAGDDTLIGNDGDDSLVGGTGADVLRGGAGSDTLNGGDGFDIADYLDAETGVTVNYQTNVFGGAIAFDTLLSIESFRLSNHADIFAGTNGDGVSNSAEGRDGDDRFEAGQGATNLNRYFGDGGNDTFVNADGRLVATGGSGNDTVVGGAGVETFFAGLGDDSMDGGGGNDKAFGEEGNDTLAGGLGIDLLNGGEGADSLNGGDGDDTLVGGAGADILNGGDGDRDVASYREATAAVTLDFYANDFGGDAAGDQFVSIERFVLSDFNDFFGGRDGDGVANWAYGADGDDRFQAGVGAGNTNRFYGGNGNDTFQSFGGGARLIASGGDGDDTLIGSSSVDIFLGEAGIDRFDGASGNDTADGGVGDDTLTGGADNDLLTGGAGADRLDGGDGTDTASYATATEAVSINLYSGTQTGDATGDQFVSIERFVLSDHNDFFAGQDYLENWASGGGGDDVFWAGYGELNTFIGGAGNDRFLSYGLGDIGTFATMVAIGGDGNDTLTGSTAVDRFYGDNGADSFTGAGGDDMARGGADADTLNGNDGSDSLYGDDGDDTLDGGNDADRLDGGAGTDILRGGEGDDILDGGTNTAPDLNQYWLADTLFGDAGNDILYGSVDYGTLYGGTGNDRLIGRDVTRDSSNNYFGEEGDDVIIAVDGVNLLDGGAGNDTLRGGAYDDIIRGGAGSDRIYGGGGMDIIQFMLSDLTAGSNDIIYDYDITGTRSGMNDSYLYFRNDDGSNLAAKDFRFIFGSVTAAQTDVKIIYLPTGATIRVLNLENPQDAQNLYTWIDGLDASAGNAQIVVLDPFNGNDDANSLTGTAGNDKIFGYGGNDTLSGVGGDDSIEGGDGDDTIIGGDGRDRLNGGNGADSISGDAGNDRLDGDDGADTLNGGDGDDLLIGGDGGDTIDGGDGIDMLSYRTSQTGITFAVDMSYRVVDIGGGSFDRFSGIELFELSEFDDAFELHDEAAGSTITAYGLGGDDLFLGSYRADVTDRFFGGDGNDRFSFNDGTMIAWGGDGDDVVEWSDMTGIGGPVTFYGEAGADTMTGSDKADLFDGGADNDVADGFLGDDTLFGRSGNDSLNGGGGNDRILGGIGDDTLDGGAGADRLQGEDGIDTLTGGGGNDTLDGGAGNDSLDGGDDNDRLTGGAGDDTLQGGAGDDSLNGGDGADAFIGGAGFDVVDYSAATSAVNLRLFESLTSGAASGDSFTDIEAFVLTSYNDFFAGVDYVANLAFGGDGDDAFWAGYGNVNTFHGGAGNDHFMSYGFGASGTFATMVAHGGAGDDTLLGSIAEDTLFGGDGNDLFDGADGNDRADGGNGNDRLTGGSGNDRLNGGAGSDTLNGGAGVDVLTGGADSDLFEISVADLVAGTSITITDFDAATDAAVNLFALDGSGNRIAVNGADFEFSLISNGTTSMAVLRYLPTGATIRLTGPNAATLGDPASWLASAGQPVAGIAITVPRFSLTGTDTADTLTGGTGDDRIDGQGGDDQLAGGAGDDRLTGGAGGDALDGGEGYDTASYATATSGVDINLRTGIHGGDAQGDTFAGIETFTLSDFNDRFVGRDGADVVNSASGGDGNDSFVGGTGANNRNLFSGGDGNDTFIGTDTGVLVARGGAGNDTAVGAGGGDTLSGGDGADSLFGMGGDDLLNGGEGADWLDGGDGIDTVTYQSASTRVVIRLQDGVLVGEVAGDTLISIERFRLSEYNDEFAGRDGVDNWANGGGGDDTFEAGAGAGNTNTFQGGAGNDTFTSVDATGRMIANGGDGNDTLNGSAAIDQFSGDAGNDVFLGMGGNDIAQGDEGDDTLDGGAGNDRLYGGDGNDRLSGGDGDDTMIGGAGADTMDGGSGNDTLSYAAATSSVYLSLYDNRIGGDALGDQISGIETFILSDFNDFFAGVDGSGVQNTARGGNGNDDFWSGWGDATNQNDFDGGEGNDTFSSYGDSTVRVSGGAGDDTFTGAGGTDTFHGDAGADVFDGRGGADLAYGGDGNDRLAGGDGIDKLYGDGGVDTLNGGAGNDSLMGGADNDTLRGDSGNDTLRGGAGADVIDGGTGYDTASYADATAGLQIVFKTVAGNPRYVSTGDAAGDTYVSIERFMLSRFDDYFGGADGAGVTNTAFGGDGSDSFDTGMGVGNINVYDGQGGDDYFLAFGGASLTAIGGAGNDFAHNLNSDSTPVGITFDGGDGDDGFWGGFGDDIANGGDGNDQLYGGGTADNGGIYSARSNYYYNGGNDTLDGGAGNDTIDGTVGDDAIIGGAGSDEMWGGSGSNTFWFDIAHLVAGDVDRIKDMNATSLVRFYQTDANGQKVDVSAADFTFGVDTAGDVLVTYNPTGAEIHIHGLSAADANPTAAWVGGLLI